MDAILYLEGIKSAAACGKTRKSKDHTKWS